VSFKTLSISGAQNSLKSIDDFLMKITVRDDDVVLHVPRKYV